MLVRNLPRFRCIRDKCAVADAQSEGSAIPKSLVSLPAFPEQDGDDRLCTGCRVEEAAEPAAERLHRRPSLEREEQSVRFGVRALPSRVGFKKCQCSEGILGYKSVLGHRFPIHVRLVDGPCKRMPITPAPGPSSIGSAMNQDGVAVDLEKIDRS